MSNTNTDRSGLSAPGLINSVPAGVSNPSIDWSPDGVLVHNLFLHDPEITILTKDRPDTEMIRRIILASTIGAKALNQADQASDVNFVRQLLEQHVKQTATRAEEIVHQTETLLNEHLNSENGTALLPIRNQVAAVQKSITDKLEEVETLLDPSHPESDLGKALGKLRAMLDDQQIDSVPNRIKATVDKLAAQDGALALSMKAVVQETIKAQLDPLREQLNSLEKEISSKKAITDLVNNSTAKGGVFEDDVAARCKSWALAAGGSSEHVGVDNHPGDVVLNFTGDGMAGLELRVALEARDDATAKGRKQVADQMLKAMEFREAEAGIYCAKSTDALGKEVGEWDEGTAGGKPWIACTYELLSVALRLTILTQRAKVRNSSSSQVDANGIRSGLAEVRTAIRRLSTIKRSATTITSSAGSVTAECDALQREIDTALVSIDRALAKGDDLA